MRFLLSTAFNNGYNYVKFLKDPDEKMVAQKVTKCKHFVKPGKIDLYFLVKHAHI